jgi:hypothetical protein
MTHLAGHVGQVLVDAQHHLPSTQAVKRHKCSAI